VDRRLYSSRAFGLSMPILREPTSGLEPLTCSLRVSGRTLGRGALQDESES
jgi:hypothetical protein